MSFKGFELAPFLLLNKFFFNLYSVFTAFFLKILSCDCSDLCSHFFSVEFFPKSLVIRDQFMKGKKKLFSLVLCIPTSDYDKLCINTRLPQLKSTECVTRNEGQKLIIKTATNLFVVYTCLFFVTFI